jgi:hypothetical protein
VKINAFLTSCILSLPLAVSLSGAAAAQAACPCFTAAVVNTTTCILGSISSYATPDHAKILMHCEILALPEDKIRPLLDNDPDFRIRDAISSGYTEYSTSIGDDSLTCSHPGSSFVSITVQQWHSCNQILIDASQ